MKMQHLIYFKTLASTNSVTLASEQLFVTQQALSKSLKAFETELGTTLFHRTNHGITLTQDGEYVLQITDKILELKHELELHFSKESALTLSGNLNMMIPQHIYELYCVKCCRNLYKHYPNFSLQLSFGSENSILQSLLANEIDLGIIYNVHCDGVPLIPIEFPLKFTAISRFRYTALVSNDSPLAKLKSVSLEQLSKYPLVFFTPDSLDNSYTYKLFSNYNIPKVYTVQTSSLLHELIPQTHLILLVIK